MPDEPEKQVEEAEFMDIAKDPAEARALHKALQQIAGGGAGDTLREMARDVLSGRVSLRQATQTSGYTDALIEGTKPFREQWDKMREKEREAYAIEGEKEIDKLRREIEEERRTRQEVARGIGGHEARGWSLY